MSEFVDQMNSLKLVGKAFDLDNLREAFAGIQEIKNMEGVEISSFINADLPVETIRSFQMIQDQMEQTASKAGESSNRTSDAFREEAESVESSVKKEIKALESLAQIRERANSRRKGTKSFFNDYDFSDQMYQSKGHGEDVYIDLSEEDEIKKYRDVLDQLNERKQEALEDARREFNNYVRNFNEDNSIEFDDSDMNRYLDNYNDYIDAIEYISNRLDEAVTKKRESLASFESTGEWDSKSIDFLIDSIKELTRVVIDLSEAFGSIDEEKGIGSLLSQLKEVGEKIPAAFDAQKLENFENTIKEIADNINSIDFSKLEKSLATLSGKDFSINLNLASGADKKGELYLQGQLEKYRAFYDELIEIGNKAGELFGGPGGITKILSHLEGRTYTFGGIGSSLEDLNKLFGEEAINDSSKSLEDRIRTMQDFISKLNEVISKDEEIQKNRKDTYEKIKQIQSLEKQIASPPSAIPEEELDKWVDEQKETLRKLKESLGIWEQIDALINETNLPTDMKTIITGQRKARNAPATKAEKVQNQETISSAVSAATGKVNPQTIEDISAALLELKDILEKGFRVKDEEGTISFFEKLSQKFEDISKSAEELQDAFAGLVGLIGTDKTDLIGIKPENVNTVTQAFIELRDVIKDIHNLQKNLGVSVKEAADKTAEAKANSTTSSGKPKKTTKTKPKEKAPVKNATESVSSTVVDNTVTAAMDPAIKNIMNMMDGLIEDAREKGSEIGNALSGGVVGGLDKNETELGKAGADAVDNVINEAKEKADIHSPSGETERQVGKPLGQGVAVGMRNSIGEIKEAGAEMAEAALISAKEAYMEVEKIMSISYHNDGGGRGTFNIDLEKFLPASISDFRIILDTINKSSNFDEVVKILSDYVAAKINVLTQTLKNVEEGTTKSAVQSMNAELNKFYSYNKDLNKRYGVDLIEDTREKTTKPKVDRTTQYQVPVDNNQDEFQNELGETRTEAQSTEETVQNLATGIQRLGQMFKEAGEDEKTFVSQLKSLKKADLVDLVNESGYYDKELKATTGLKKQELTDILSTNYLKNRKQEVGAYGRQAAQDMRKIDDWIFNNVNSQMSHPVAVADTQDEINNVISKITEFRDRLKDISQNDYFGSLSQSMQSEISNSITQLNNLIEIEQELLNVQKEFDEQNAKRQNTIYHAGSVSQLNKAETNGRFYGSNRGTGYYGTGYYFVDSAHKGEIDKSRNYSSLPYTSVDISQYDNLFKANTNEIAGKLHQFLENITKYTQGKDFDVSGLFAQFKDVFGDTILDFNSFDAKLNELTAYMEKSNLNDRGDSVSTQFMKSLGYGGVDTRGTNYADTRYGTVIYDLKEESVLQANITDELQKQGDMLEKMSYASGEVWDKDEDARIQAIIDKQKEAIKIREEYSNMHDALKIPDNEDIYDNARSRLEEINNDIDECQYGLEHAEEEAREFAQSLREIQEDDSRLYQALGISSDDLLLLQDAEATEEEIAEHAEDIREKYQNRIAELKEEKAELEAQIPLIEQKVNSEKELNGIIYDQAKYNAENGLEFSEKDITGISKYLQAMKTMLKEDYNEATALKQALNLLTEIKSGDISGLMDRFNASNKPSNAMLKAVTGMPVNNQENRNAALRSINPTQYDELIRAQAESAKAELEKQKTEFDQKWEEFVSHMIGEDVFADMSKMQKGQVLKALQDQIDSINQAFLKGETEGKEYSNRYAQMYLNHLNAMKDLAEESRTVTTNDVGLDGKALSQKEVDEIHAKAVAYDELIAKKKEEYGITTQQTESNINNIKEEEKATTALIDTRKKLNVAGRTNEQVAEDIMRGTNARQLEKNMIEDVTEAELDLIKAKKQESEIGDSIIASNGVEVITDRANIGTKNEIVPGNVGDEITPFERLRQFIETDLIKAIQDKDIEFEKEVEVVTRVVNEELEQLERLRLFLYNDIPLAIAEKNHAFEDELSVVKYVVEEEINEFDNLKAQISQKIQEGINAIDVEEIKTKFNTIFDNIDYTVISKKINESISSLDSDEIQKNFQTIFDTIKITIKESSIILPDLSQAFQDALGKAKVQADFAPTQDTNIGEYKEELNKYLDASDNFRGMISNMEERGVSQDKTVIDTFIQKIEQYIKVLENFREKYRDVMTDTDLNKLNSTIGYTKSMKDSFASGKYTSESNQVQEETQNNIGVTNEKYKELEQTIQGILKELNDLKRALDITDTATSLSKEWEELQKVATYLNNIVLFVEKKNEKLKEEGQIVDTFVSTELQKLKDFADAIKAINDNINDLNTDIDNIGSENTGGLFSSIREILQRTDELKNFAEILSHSSEEIKEAEEALNGTENKDSTESASQNIDKISNSVNNLGDSIDNVKKKEIIDPNKIQDAVDEVKGLEQDIGDVIRIIDTLDEKGTVVARVLQGTKLNAYAQLRADDNESDPELTVTQYRGITGDQNFDLQKIAKQNELGKLEQQMQELGFTSDYLKGRLSDLNEELQETKPNAGFSTYEKHLKLFKTDLDEAAKTAKILSKENQEMYNNDIASIKKVKDARTEYNNVVAGNIRNSEKATTEDVAKAQDRITTATNNAAEAMKNIIKMYGEGKISAEQYINALKVTSSDDYIYGSEDSMRNIRNAQQEQNNKEYENLVAILNKAVDAQSKLNELQATHISGKNQTELINEQMQKVEQATRTAEKAIEDLYDMYSSGKISGSQLGKATENLFAFGEKGSTASRTKIDNAITKQWDNARNAVAKYEDAVKALQALQERHANGENVSGRITTATREMNRDLEKAKDQLNNLKSLAAQFPGIPKLGEAIKDIEKAINNYKTVTDDLRNFKVNDKNSGFENAIKGYDTLSKRAEKYYKILLKQQEGIGLTGNEYSFLERNKQHFENAALGAEKFKDSLGDVATNLETVKNKEKEFNDSITTAMGDAVGSEINNLEKLLTDLGNKNGNKQFQEEYESLKEKIGQFSIQFGNQDWSNKTIEDFNKVGKAAKELRDKISELNTDIKYQPVNKVEKEALNRRMSEWSNNNKAAREAVAQIDILQQKLKTIDDQGSLNDIAADFERIKANANDAGNVGQTFAQKLRTSFSNLGRYLLSFGSFYDVINVLRQGVTVVREMDTALTELRKVSDESLDSLKSYQLETYKMADAVGTTAVQIMDSTADWVRLGETLEQAKESASLSTVLLNVSEFDSIDAATESLVAMSQAYKDLGKLEIIDKLNNCSFCYFYDYSIEEQRVVISSHLSRFIYVVSPDCILYPCLGQTTS